MVIVELLVEPVLGVLSLLLLIGDTYRYHLDVRPTRTAGFARLTIYEYSVLMRLCRNHVLTLYDDAVVRVRYHRSVDDLIRRNLVRIDGSLYADHLSVRTDDVLVMNVNVRTVRVRTLVVLMDLV